MIGNAKYDLCFDENYSPNRYHLLELNDTLYKAVEANEPYFNNKSIILHRLYIRGLPDAEAVICTKKETFLLKKVETSNTVYLTNLSEGIEENGEDKSIIISTKIEFTVDAFHTTPKVEELRNYLSKHIYGNAEHQAKKRKLDESVSKHIKDFSFNSLLIVAQCSEVELHILLDKIGAILIENEYYLLSNESKCNYEDIVINYLIEKSVSYKDVSLNKLMESYTSGNIHIIKSILQLLSSERNINDKDDDIYHLSPIKLVQSKIKILFNQESYKNETKTVKKTTLINDLKESLPDDIEIDEKSMFKGYLLPYSNDSYQYFPVDELSINAVERFKELFKFRPNWIYDDIEPYIVDLTNLTTKVSDLLMKYTKCLFKTVLGVGRVKEYYAK